MLREIYEARRRRKIREEVGKVVISGTFAAVIGAAAGILLAPKSGKETREDIIAGSKEVAMKAKASAQDFADELYLKGLEAKHTAKRTVEKLSAKTEEIVDGTKQKSQEISEKVKNKAEEVAEEVEEKSEDIIDEAEDLVEEVKEKKNK